MALETLITIITLFTGLITFFISFKVSVQKDMEYMKKEIALLKEMINKSEFNISKEIDALSKKQAKYNNMQMRLLKLEIKNGVYKKHNHKQGD